MNCVGAAGTSGVCDPRLNNEANNWDGKCSSAQVALRWCIGHVSSVPVVAAVHATVLVMKQHNLIPLNSHIITQYDIYAESTTPMLLMGSLQLACNHPYHIRMMWASKSVWHRWRLLCRLLQTQLGHSGQLRIHPSSSLPGSHVQQP